jgi:hypothetical protein
VKKKSTLLEPFLEIDIESNEQQRKQSNKIYSSKNMQ